jgi:hypothetical protein
MVDAHLIDNETASSRTFLLAGLLSHGLIRTYRYADDGPPPEVPRSTHDWAGEVAPGWILVKEESDPGISSHSVVRAIGDTVGRSSIVGQDVLRLVDHGLGASANNDPEAQAQRRKDAVAAMAAESIGADLYITDRDYLHEISWPLAKSVTFMRPDDALPLVSLYLRTQGEFLVWIGPSYSSRFNRGLFYWVGTRELLPEGWRWFTACVQSDANAHNSPMTLLGQSALQRVDRSLELRDDVHRAMNQPQDNDVADDALRSFDSCLVFLLGALDATARVAHAALGLKSSVRNAGWHRKDFRKEVAHACPVLGTVLATGGAGRQTLDILVPLRNTVHSTGLVSIAFSTAINRRERTLIDLTAGMEAKDRPTFEAAIKALGGDGAWGIDRSIPDRILADPGVVVDRIFEEVVVLLNAIMAATPVESLPNVALAPGDLRPPSRRDDTFSEQNRLSIRWQLGL